MNTFSVPGDKVVVVPNAVDMELFDKASSDRSRWGLPENGVVAGFVGYIYKDTGLETVIKAMAILKKQGIASPNLLIAGGGPDLLRLQEMSEYLEVADKIVWTGELPQEDIPSVIASCDIMLAPFTRRIFEIKGSSALKIFEYLACDKPILASDGYDHKFIEEFGFGRLVEPEDDMEWSEALAEVNREKVSLNGRGIEYVQRDYTYEALAEKIVKLTLFEEMDKRKD
jgi:glycosyltransferase involved in cell wall biosynthesis